MCARTACCAGASGRDVFVNTLPAFLGPRPSIQDTRNCDSRKVTTFSFFGITIPISSQLKVDLDLKIFDKNGTQVGYSGSWDNSYEVAEFDAIPGETYEIRIRRWSGSDWTWYGLAWTVTGSLLDLGTIVAAGETRLARLVDDLPHLAEAE